MSLVAVRCVALTKDFGSLRAVDGLDLTVERGQILALLGPSGCGKTTTLRLIAGFETPDAGVVEVGGRLVVGDGISLPPEQRRVGIVFQDYALFPHLDVTENVAYGLARGRGRPRRLRGRAPFGPAADGETGFSHHRREELAQNKAEWVKELLDLVGLTDMEQRMPHELSGGQQQRVALARALAPRPEVLLLDEPFSNLDAGLRTQMREEIKEILKSSRSTAIFVTHDQEEALFMGDRVAVLSAGRLEQVGTPDEVFHAPASRFVAEFMGQSDFLPGQVTPEGVLTEIGLLRQRVDLPSGSPIEVAIRADDVTLEVDGGSSVRVVARLFRGAVNVYRVRLASGRIVHSLQPHTVIYAPGTPVRARAEPNHWLPCFRDGQLVQAAPLAPPRNFQSSG